jgi:hypothetical protein
MGDPPHHLEDRSSRVSGRTGGFLPGGQSGRPGDGRARGARYGAIGDVGVHMDAVTAGQGAGEIRERHQPLGGTDRLAESGVPPLDAVGYLGQEDEMRDRVVGARANCRASETSLSNTWAPLNLRRGPGWLS